jgi:branched-subunit amino acid transport protein
MMQEFYLIVGMMVVTFIIRYGALGLGGRLTLSPTLIDLLRYIPPAVLTAIVVPEILMPNNELLTGISPRFISAIVAIAMSYYTKNLLWTISIGMLAFLGLEAIF